VRRKIERLEYCDAHFKRLRVQVRAVRRVNGTAFCANCFRGLPIRTVEMDGEYRRSYLRALKRLPTADQT
jgi:hypothetical protein